MNAIESSRLCPCWPVRFADRGCGVAIEQLPQYSTNRSTVTHVRDVCINWKIIHSGPIRSDRGRRHDEKILCALQSKDPPPPDVGRSSVVTHGPHGATGP